MSQLRNVVNGHPFDMFRSVGFKFTIYIIRSPINWETTMVDTTTRPDAAPHPMDALVRDPAGMTPVGDEAQFGAMLECMVADYAPRIFAVVQEYGTRVDGKIAAWGMAFEDRAELVSISGGTRMSVQSPDEGVRRFRFGSHITPRLVWVNPAAATTPDIEDSTE
jgi:hypothetical protein